MLLTSSGAMGRRLGGMRLLCFFLAWHAVSCVGGLWLLIKPNLPGYFVWILPALGAAALTAALACVGLWLMHWWGLLALRACMAVWFLILVGMALTFPTRLFLGGYWGLAGFGFVLSWGCGSLNRWVGRQFASA